MVITSLLIIDDNEDFNTLVKFVLEQDTDWQIFTALNAQQGLEIARSHQPSAILLDVILSGLDGLDIYNLLKSNPATQSIPIIFVTAMPGTAKIIREKIAEDVAIITKPFNILTLKNQISDICDRQIKVSRGLSALSPTKSD